MRPVIMITASLERQESGTDRLQLSEQYCRKILEAGGLPAVCFPQEPEEYLERGDGLLLSGGGDVEPWRYGQEFYGGRQDFCPQRDEFELELTRLFVKAQKPIFGICRGHQVLNVALGGELIQDLPSMRQTKHQAVCHMVGAQQGLLFEKLFGASFEVNSFHHQAVLKPGEKMIEAAWSGEAINEATVSSCGRFFSVQWHPERMENQAPLFDYFIALCRKK